MEREKEARLVCTEGLREGSEALKGMRVGEDRRVAVFRGSHGLCRKEEQPLEG
jgi:hypothetical protein